MQCGGVNTRPPCACIIMTKHMLACNRHETLCFNCSWALCKGASDLVYCSIKWFHLPLIVMISLALVRHEEIHQNIQLARHISHLRHSRKQIILQAVYTTQGHKLCRIFWYNWKRFPVRRHNHHKHSKSDEDHSCLDQTYTLYGWHFRFLCTHSSNTTNFLRSRFQCYSQSNRWKPSKHGLERNI